MRKSLLILATLVLCAANAGAKENSITDFFDDSAKDVQATLGVRPDDGRKTLAQAVGDLWRDLWST